eukprot:2375215-Karenia_brevis.AAC.1
MCAPSVRTYDAGQASEAIPVHVARQKVEYLLKKIKRHRFAILAITLYSPGVCFAHTNDIYTNQSTTA